MAEPGQPGTAAYMPPYHHTHQLQFFPLSFRHPAGGNSAPEAGARLACVAAPKETTTTEQCQCVFKAKSSERDLSACTSPAARAPPVSVVAHAAEKA